MRNSFIFQMSRSAVIPNIFDTRVDPFFFFLNPALLFTAKLFLVISFKLAHFYYPLIHVVFYIWRTFIKFINGSELFELALGTVCVSLF